MREGAAFVSSRGHTNAAKVGQAIIPALPEYRCRGWAGVIMGDGSVLSFGLDSELTLDDYRFAPASDELRLRATLNRGTLSLIAGDMARLDPQAIAVETPEGRVGVRGGRCYAEGETVKARLMSGTLLAMAALAARSIPT